MSAKRNTLKILGVAESVADAIENKIYHGNMPKTVKPMVEKLRQSTHAAFRLWDYNVSKSDLKKIGDAYDEAQARSKTLKDSIDIVAYIALSIGLVVDLESHITHPMRRDALNAVINALERLDRYYSRKKGVDDMYIDASEAVAVFEDIAC